MFGLVQSGVARAPSVFRSDEVDFHKFSAILATTEPFRQQCINDLKRLLNPLQKMSNSILGKKC